MGVVYCRQDLVQNSGVGYLSKLSKVAVTLLFDVLDFCVEDRISFYVVVEHFESQLE